MGGLGGGGGQRDAGHVGPPLVQCGEGEVVRPEVMSPLGDAVRLVDGEQRDRAAVEEPQCGLRPEAFRRQVEQVEVAGEERGLDLAALAGLLGGIQRARAHAEDAQGVDLVVHERDEGRDDYPDAFAHQCGYLVAERLAAPGRHEHDRVATGDDVIDDLLLARAVVAVAEHAPQHP